MPESCLRVAQTHDSNKRFKIAKHRELFEVKGMKFNRISTIDSNANFAIYYDVNLQD
jgi:hypothetical protein